MCGRHGITCTQTPRLLPAGHASAPTSPGTMVCAPKATLRISKVGSFHPGCPRWAYCTYSVLCASNHPSFRRTNIRSANRMCQLLEKSVSVHEVACDPTWSFPPPPPFPLPLASSPLQTPLKGMMRCNNALERLA